jgi:hypothetical protein
VFVSHSGADTWVAKQIAREIAACGAIAFLDEAEIDGAPTLKMTSSGFLRRRMN